MTSAWPMIATCLERQWNGYTWEERIEVERQWEKIAEGGVPGLVGSTVYSQVTIWGVEHWDGDRFRFGGSGDNLMAVKFDE